jgi:hypothetical protein
VLVDMIFSPPEVAGGRPQVHSMTRVIMVCATFSLAACAAEQPAPDYAAIIVD